MNMKGGSGTWCKPQYSENMLNVFNPHLPTPAKKAVVQNLRFLTQEKFADIWLVLAIQTITPVGFWRLTLACKNKQGNHCNWHKSVKETCLKKSSALSILFEWGENPCNFGPTDIVAKKPQPLANIKKDEKKGERKREVRAHPLIMQMYNTRGGGGGCMKRKEGGGGSSFIIRLYMSQVICKRYDNMRNT